MQLISIILVVVMVIFAFAYAAAFAGLIQLWFVSIAASITSIVLSTSAIVISVMVMRKRRGKYHGNTD